MIDKFAEKYPAGGVDCKYILYLCKRLAMELTPRDHYHLRCLALERYIHGAFPVTAFVSAEFGYSTQRVFYAPFYQVCFFYLIS